MAERRMLSKSVIESDAFLDFPCSAQILYVHLSMNADDDGFVGSPKRIQKMIGANDEDLNLLISSKFLIAFESGVIAIRHWKVHNYIKSDRYKPTVYTDEKAMLTLESNKAYAMCIQNGSGTDTQDSIGKDSIGEDSIGEDNFCPPSAGEVEKYCKAENIKINAEDNLAFAA